jgi:hypothetical protein
MLLITSIQGYAGIDGKGWNGAEWNDTRFHFLDWLK